MPIFVQKIDFAIGVISLVFSFLTLCFAMRVNYQVRHLRELELFHKEREGLISCLDGYRLSIENEHLKTDQFRCEIHNKLLDIDTSYSFFRRKTKHLLKQAIEQTSHSNTDWDILCSHIIGIKNCLKGEA